MMKTKLNYHDRSNQVRFVKKTRQDNGVKDGIGAVYAKNDMELLWPIGLGVVYDKNLIGQQHDRSYWYDLCQKWY